MGRGLLYELICQSKIVEPNAAQPQLIDPPRAESFRRKVDGVIGLFSAIRESEGFH
jgi:hypothetical protein